MTTRRVRVLCAALAALLAPHQAWAQCAMCRLALQSPEGLRLIGALRSGILILLFAPVACFAAITFLTIRMRRRFDTTTEG